MTVDEAREAVEDARRAMRESAQAHAERVVEAQEALAAALAAEQ